MQTATLTIQQPDAAGTPEQGRFILFWVEGHKRPLLGTYNYDDATELYVYKTLAPEQGKAPRAIYFEAECYAYADEAHMVIL